MTRFTEKDLDALLWEWAQETIKEHDSGYPSNYELCHRVDNGTIYIPDYFPRPKIHHLANTIFSLQTPLRNPIIAKYLFGMKVPEIAKHCQCHNATIYRKLGEARTILLAEMRNFVYKSYRL